MFNNEELATILSTLEFAFQAGQIKSSQDAKFVLDLGEKIVGVMNQQSEAVEEAPAE